jgi:hypothetical protein
MRERVTSRIHPCALKSYSRRGGWWYHRLVEVIDELTFLVQTEHFAKLTESIQRYGSRTDLLESTEKSALFALSSGRSSESS